MTHDAFGRALTQTDARTGTMTYDEGILNSINYSDTTPDIVYAYDSFGRLSSVTRAGEPHASYAYDAVTLVLKQESLNQDLSAIASNLERCYDDFLRPEKNFIDLGGAGPIYSATYGYDDAGRLSTVLSQAARSFTYGYLPNSYGMVETVTGPVHTVTDTYESSRNVLSLKENEVGSTLISSYDYAVNNFGQRTQLATDGSAFSVQPALVWGYNSHGELIEASDSSSSNFDRAYEYDAIGNRTMIPRWTASGMLWAEAGYRKVRGYRDLPALAAALSLSLIHI